MLERLHRDEGIALITVMLAILVIGAMTALMLTLSIRQQEDSAEQEKEDIVIAGTEAILERYAAKLTLDPLFYIHWVDEAERARVCSDASSPSYSVVFEPANSFDDTCETWTYQNPDRDGDGNPDPNADWWVHPLLEGTNVDTTAVDSDDVSVAMEISPPGAGVPLTVLVAGRHGSRTNRRVIDASVQATSLSEFFRVTENSLSYGAGAEIFGKVYSGNNLSFGCCPQGKIHRNAYAEGSITNPPVFLNGSEGFDTSGSYGDVRIEFPQPLDFNNFWDDLSIIVSVACDSGGVCLTESGVNAWLVHPYVSGGVGRLEIWKSYDSRSQGCVNQEEYWWLYPHDPTGTDTFVDMWTYDGTIDVPTVGVVWTDAHLVVGHHGWSGGADVNGDGLTDSVVKGSLTMYAGTSSNVKNIVINSDIYYDGQDPVTLATSNNDTFALIASDEININPNAVGSDKDLTVNASILGQTNKWRVAKSCGSSGGSVTPGGSTLNWRGSIATKSTGSIAGSFPTRNYLFDDRLEWLRPPFFPLLDDNWSYEDWKELPLPDWAK